MEVHDFQNAVCMYTTRNTKLYCVLSTFYEPYLISKHLSSINFTIFSIILLLVYSLLWGCKTLWGPAITTAHTNNLAAAVLTKAFLCSGPFEHSVLTAWKVGIWVTMQSNAKLASWRMNLLASAVLQRSVSTNISNS